MRVAIYLRVSTDDQHPEAQEPAVRAMIAARPGVMGIEVYEERASGKAATSRPVWQSVMDGARVGRHGLVAVWSLDRIGRSRVRTAADLAQLARWGCAVISVGEGWLDQQGPVRDLLIQVFAWVAEAERDRIVARTRAGLARVRAGLEKGAWTSASGRVIRRLGRPAAIQGPALVQLETLARSGVSACLAARRLGLAESTVRRWYQSRGADPRGFGPEGPRWMGD